MSQLSLQAITERLRDDAAFHDCLAVQAPAALGVLKCLEGYCLTHEELTTLLVLLDAQWEPNPPRYAKESYTQSR